MLVGCCLLAVPANAEEITILFTGETHSMLGPCTSCPVQPNGGLARRATEVTRIRRGGLQPTLLLDTGAMFAGGVYDEYTLGPVVDLERTRANLSALAHMGYDALCIGDEELAYGPDFLQEASKLAQAPFVSANLTLPDGSRGAWQPYVIREAGGKRFAIIGVTTSDTYAFSTTVPPEGFQVLDPVASVRGAVEEVRPRVDFVLLLSHLGEDETRSLVGQVPGINIALNGHRKSTGDLYDVLGQTILANFNYQGRELSRLDLRLAADGSLDDFRVREIPLSDRVADDPDVAAIVKGFEDRLGAELGGQARTQLDLYVMSRCPFAQAAEQVIYPAVLEFGRERVRIRRFYIIHENPDGSLGSLHGPAEIAGDMDEICLEKIYGDRLTDFFALRAQGGVSGSWEDWAGGIGLEPGPVHECLGSPYPVDILRRHWMRTQRMRIDASPTIYINNKELVVRGELTREKFLAALCAALPSSVRPTLCAQLPECFSSADCQQPGKIGECVNAGQPDAHCVFHEPVKCALRVLTSSQARLADASGVVTPLLAIFPGLQVEEVDIESPAGKELAQRANVRWLPAYFIERAVDQYPSWQDMSVSADLLGNDYVLKPEYTGANVDYPRPRQEGQLDLFFSALAPQAVEVAAELMDAVAIPGEGVAWDLRLHWLVSRTDEGALRAPGGIAEIEEAARQVAILRYHPQSLSKYLRERAKVGNSSYWEVPLKAAGLDPEEIRLRAQEAETFQHLVDDAQRAAEFGLAGPAVLLYANQELADLPNRVVLEQVEERIGLGAAIITLAYTGNLNGLLEPCGCPGNPFGGMARMATALKSIRLRSPNTILVDSGDFLSPGPVGEEAELWDAEGELVRLPYLLRAAELLKYQAVAVGEQEFVFGPQTLDSLMRSDAIPFIASNLSWDGKPQGELIRMLRVGGKRVIVLSLTAPSAFSFAPETVRDRVRVQDPLECARGALEQAYPGSDLVVVLFHGRLQEARALAEACRMIDVLVLGHPGKMLQKPEQVGHTLIVSAGRDGESLGELAIRLGRRLLMEGPNASEASIRPLRPRIEVVRAGLIPLDDKVAEDPEILAIIAEYDASVGQEFTRKQAAAGVDEFSRDETCGSCHPSQYEQWRSTRHAHAMKTLEAVGKQNRPDCVSCHTARPLDKSKALLPSVSCVACHDVGPLVTDGGQTRHAHITRPVPADACLLCHTSGRSPNFVWETYRSRVVH